jgi:heptosyltransferase-2
MLVGCQRNKRCRKLSVGRVSAKKSKKNTKKMQKILIVQTAFIGDAILATAILEKMRAFYPQAQIDIMLRAGSEGLLESHPFVGNIIIWDKKQKWRSWWHCLQTIRAARYDVLINLQRYGSTALLAAWSKAREIRGFDSSFISRFFSHRFPHLLDASGKTRSPHETARNQSLIADLTDNIAAAPRLYPTEQHRAQAAEILATISNNNITIDSQFVSFSPASVWATKQLPVSKWLELAQKLPPEVAIILLGSKSDAPLCQDIISQSQRDNIYNAAGKFGFLHTAAMMQRARMNYVNDSAPLHIASAVDAPTTAFFCSTVPNFGFTPLATQSHILQVAAPLACRPCGIHGHKKCPEGHFSCGNISPQTFL